jgi:hypothetical protein
MPLTSRLVLELTGSLTTALDFTTPVSSVDLRQQVDFVTGTGAGQADKQWADQRTLTASSTEDVDLTGTQTDAFGATITLARIKGLLIRASAANTNNVVVGAASSNAWAALLNATGTITLRPGTGILLAAGSADATAYAVTAGTGDLLKVANSGAGSSVIYDIAVIGCSA